MPKLDPVARSPEGASGLACDRRLSRVCHLGGWEEGARAIFTPGDGGACTNGVGGRGPASDNIGEKASSARPATGLARNDAEEQKPRGRGSRGVDARHDARSDRRSFEDARDERRAFDICLLDARTVECGVARGVCPASSAGSAMMGESCERSPISVFPAIWRMTWHVQSTFSTVCRGSKSSDSRAHNRRWIKIRVRYPGRFLESRLVDADPTRDPMEGRSSHVIG